MPERGQVTPKEAQPKKEPMSDAQIGDLLAAIGNHEGKALLLASMKPGQSYTRYQLGSLMKEYRSKNGKMKIDGSKSFAWCEQSLAQIGLVAKGDGISGYQKTEKGDEQGQALAGHLLEFSEKHPEVSLYQLFGTTQSSSKTEGQEGGMGKLRAPLTRLRIFSELVTRDLPIREVDLSDAFTHDYPHDYNDNPLAPIKNSLWNLSQNDVITYKAIKANSSFYFYRLANTMPDGEPPPYRRRHSLTRDVFTILREADREFSPKDMYEVLIDKYPEKRKLTGFRSAVSGTLKHLEKEGYAEGQGDFVLGQQSEIKLNDGQREILTDLVTLIEKFREGDPIFLAEGKAKAAAIVSDTERFAALLEKAKAASPNVNYASHAETATRLKALVVEAPGITRTDLQESFFERYGKRLGDANINLILRGMRKVGEIDVEKKGSKQYYSVVQKEDSDGAEVAQPSLPQSGTIFESPQE
jgi:hypothetical protein